MRMAVTVACLAMAASACQLRSAPGAPTSPVTPAPVPASDGSGPMPIPATTIAAGQTIHASVTINDPHCWDQWDATTVCRQFDLVASRDGRLTVKMAWEGPDRSVLNPDMVVVAGNANYMYCEGSSHARACTLPAITGLTYRIVVLSYADGLDFALSTELTP